MRQKNKVIETYGLWFADLMIIVISFLSSTYIRFGNFRDMGDRESHFLVCLSFLLFATIYNFFLDWNRNFLRRTLWQEAGAIIQYHVIMILTVGFLMFMLQWADAFSRFVMALFFVMNLLLTWVTHTVIKKIFLVTFSSDKSVIKLLVIAESDFIAEVIKRLQGELEIPYQIVAAVCLDENLTGQEIEQIPVIADKESLMDVVTTMPLDEVFIQCSQRRQAEVEELVQGFDEMGVDCHYRLELPDISFKRSAVEEFGGFTVITYTRFQSSYKRLLIKRVIDIVGGLTGVLITAVFYPFVALAIKLDSPGPVLFSQVRIGRNGRRFRVYKFRSMYLDAEERKKELEEQNEIQGLMFKIENDPRITRVGKFIRKTSIDELPQFYNVLKGDMSLVGTRPPTEDEFEKYNQYYRRRISMTPGLTGMWQVSGRSDVDNFDDVVKFDLKYIDSWSLKLDFKILWQTIWVVIKGRGSK